MSSASTIQLSHDRGLVRIGRVADAVPVSGARAAQRHRDSVHCEDAATYRCRCGHDFLAAVSTQVSCPRCGGEQAW